MNTHSQETVYFFGVYNYMIVRDGGDKLCSKKEVSGCLRTCFVRDAISASKWS